MPGQRILAFAFAALLAIYSGMWMSYIRLQAVAYKSGLAVVYLPSQNAALIERVDPGSPAELAGIRKNERLVAVDGIELDTPEPLYALARGGPRGAEVVVTVAAPSGEEREAALTLQRADRIVVTDRPVGAASGDRGSRANVLVLNALNLYPLLFLIVAVVVLLQRPEDRNAWAMAVTFAGFIAAAPVLSIEPLLPPAVRGFVLAFSSGFSLMLPGVLYYFLAIFPAPSSLDRRVPWLKYVLVGIGLATAVPVAVGCLVTNTSEPIWWLAEFTQAPVPRLLVLGYDLGALGLAVASLTLNAFRGAPGTRRKTRVVLAGTLLAVLPLTVLGTWAAIAGGPPDQAVPFAAWAAAILALTLLPLSVAYAVVKHRVMELPVLFRRSARYLLVRRGAITLALLLGLGMTFVFAAVLEWIGGPEALSLSGGLVAGALFGSALALGGERLWRPLQERIDRAFFRNAYDARRLLQGLAASNRVATDREALALQVEGALEEALHPRALHVYLRSDAGAPVLRAGGNERDILADCPLPLDLPALLELARRGQPLVVDPEHLVAGGGLEVCAPLAPEVLVPMVGRAGQLEGLVLLGPRLSEEPYSREDRALVQSAATQAGLALENIRLAESMAARLDAERRAAREMEIAKAVQAKLLPQEVPAFDTLDYAGACIQARQVGGDYYDFVRLSDRQLGLVLADISGKGISAALLMASLQAGLRAQYARAPDDLAAVLRAVNRQFYDSTAVNHYATLFFGLYDAAARRLRYANCGHLPPVVLHADGRIVRLACTAPVVGLFDEPWECRTAEIAFGPGDVLVVYSDGVSEAQNGAGDEFGEERLIDIVREQRTRGARVLVETVLDAVRGFSGPAQYDDVTLIAARCC